MLDYRRRGLAEDTIRTKTGHFDIVTEADVASERLIFDTIREAFPDHGFHGEESAGHRLPDEPWFWVVDPLDGTTNFAHGLPIFAVNMALIHDGLPVLGVTCDPSSGRTYWAERGGGAWVRFGGQAHGSVYRPSRTWIMPCCPRASSRAASSTHRTTAPNSPRSICARNQ